MYYRTVDKKPTHDNGTKDDFINNEDKKVLELWIPRELCPTPTGNQFFNLRCDTHRHDFTDEQIRGLDIVYVHQLMANFSHLLIYEALNKLSIEIGLTNCFVNCSSGEKRAHCVIVCSFYFLWDDWFEPYFVTGSDEQMVKLEKHVNDLSRMFRIADETGQVCTETIDGFDLDLEKSMDFYKAHVIILKTAKAVFDNDRLFRKWSKTVSNYLNAYFKLEIPVMRRATSENRYLTNEEYADFRYVTTGLGWLTSYQFTEDMDIEFFSDVSELQSIAAQWGGLHNEIMSIGKSPTRGDALEVENRVHHQLWLQGDDSNDHLSLFNAMKEICRQADERLEGILRICEFTSLRLKPFPKMACISWIDMFPYYVESSRYGWQLVDSVNLCN